MSVTARIPTPLRKVTNGADKAEVEAGSLSAIMSSLNNQFPGIRERLCNEDGSLRSFVNVYINGCLLYTSPSPRDPKTSRMPSSA